MTLLDNLEAETIEPGGWRRIGIAEAVASRVRPLRCIACHGPMKAMKAARMGPRAHFAHLKHHGGCPKGDGFDGLASPHPDALG